MVYIPSVILGLCLIALVWLYVWFAYATRRNNATAELRHQLIEFAYQQMPDWEKRTAWYKSQPSYQAMSRVGPFPPFTSKPLSRMIGGEYEEAFYRWRAGN